LIWLALLVTLLMSLDHWLVNPLLGLGSALLQLRALPWLAIGLLLWLLAGPPSSRR